MRDILFCLMCEWHCEKIQLTESRHQLRKPALSALRHSSNPKFSSSLPDLPEWSFHRFNSLFFFSVCCDLSY